MGVAFAGTHIPLLALLLYFASTTEVSIETRISIVGIILLATLIGTAATLLALHKLLSPVNATVMALRNYWSHKELPNLPTEYTDDVGILMADTTRIIKLLDSSIRRLKDYDDLTGLPNRTLFTSRLMQAASTLGSQQRITVYLIDIDGFRALNEVEGYKVGDRVLSEIAARLMCYAGSKDRLARLGNDEFAFFTLSNHDVEPTLSSAQELLMLLSHPGDPPDTSFRVTASIGISVYQKVDACTPDQLIANAYTALQQVKRKGSNSYHFYSAELSGGLHRQLKLAGDLRLALEKEQLYLNYQPRIDWQRIEMVGVECLVRWQHPELGKISPAEFIPIAEATGLVIPIGEWILRTACQQNKLWQQSGLPLFTVAVNLSARQIEQPGLVDFVQLVLDETRLDPRFLELEVTESLLMGDTKHARSVLEALHDKGIALALDDFGTGYSSLSYLREFPFDILKIDKAFVKDMIHNPDAAEIVRAIVALGKGLQMGLIAEGIETEAQLSQIKAHGCHEIQGYYFSPPVSADELELRLRQPNSWKNERRGSIKGNTFG